MLCTRLQGFVAYRIITSHISERLRKMAFRHWFSNSASKGPHGRLILMKMEFGIKLCLKNDTLSSSCQEVLLVKRGKRRSSMYRD